MHRLPRPSPDSARWLVHKYDTGADADADADANADADGDGDPIPTPAVTLTFSELLPDSGCQHRSLSRKRASTNESRDRGRRYRDRGRHCRDRGRCGRGRGRSLGYFLRESTGIGGGGRGGR